MTKAETKVRQTEQNKKAVLVALEKTLGVVTQACKMVGVGRTNFYNWYEQDKEFAKQVDEMQEVALDFAESKLHSRIKDGSDTAIIFFLKTKGKKRGYVERTEFANVDAPAFVVKPEQKGVMKVLKTVDERNRKTGN